MPKTRIPSPSRSQGAITPRRDKPRRSRSVCSPAHSNASGRLTSVIDQFKDKDMESFSISPMKSRWSVLTDNTDIDEPQRKSWWKNLNENSQEFMEVLEDNKATDSNNPIEDITDIEISQENKNYSSVDLPESSDNESIQSIVLTQRKLFTLKENKPQKKFGKLVGARETLTKLHKSNATFHEKTITAGTKDLFQGTKKSKPVFSAALLNMSANKTTVDKTTENVIAEPKIPVKNIFGNRPAKKRKNIFADFILSESEHEVSDIQVTAKQNLVKRTKNDKLEDYNNKGQKIDIEQSERVNLEEMVNQKHNEVTKCEDEPMNESKKADDKSNKNQELNQPQNKYHGLVGSRESMDKLHTTNIARDEEVVTAGGKDLFQSKELNIVFSSTLLHTSPNKTVTVEPKITLKNIFGHRSPNRNIFADFLESESEHEISEIVPEKEESTFLDNPETKSGQENKLNAKKNVGAEQTAQKSQQDMVGQTGKDNESEEDKEINSEQKVEDNQEEIVSEEEGDGNKSEDDEEMKYEESDEEILEKNTLQDEGCSDSLIQEVGDEMDDNQHGDQSKEDKEIENQRAKNELKDDERNENNLNDDLTNKSRAKEQKSYHIDNPGPELNDDEKSSAKNYNEPNESLEIENEREEDQEIDECVDADEAIPTNGVSEQDDQEEMEVDNYENEEKDSVDDKQENNIRDNDETVENEEDSVESEEEDENEENEVDNYETEVDDQIEENEVDKDDSEVEDENEIDAEYEESEVDNDQNEENAVNNDENEDTEVDVDENKVDDEKEENEENIDENEENMEVQSRVISSEEVIEESPNVTHDTTGKNKKKIKSPEVVLHDKTKQEISFIAKGRNTSIRETKTMYKDLNIKPSLAPPRDSIGLSAGDSSAEGSGWDSHRTTRKTLRQTFGKDFTPRKSLRALVMEKSAKQTLQVQTLQSETALLPQANSTEYPQDSNCEVDLTMESDHEVSKTNRLTTLKTYLEKIRQQNVECNLKMEQAIKNSLNAPPTQDPLSLFKVPSKPPPRRLKPTSNKPKKPMKSIFFDQLPPEVIEDMKYKPPKRFQPSNASWITKRLYKFLETKLEPKYDYKARVRAEKLVETIYHFAKDLRRHNVAPIDSVDVLKQELARLKVVKTHFEFYEFFNEFMPREVRIKVVPDIVNRIPLPRHGVFADILR